MLENMRPLLLTIVGAIMTILIIIVVVMLSRKKEGVQFKVTGQKDKRECQRYHLKLYWDCVKNAGGYDTNGNCWANTEPNLVACNKTYF